jgi:hypothetical protein
MWSQKDPDHGKAIAIAAYIRQLGVAKWVNLLQGKTTQ